MKAILMLDKNNGMCFNSRRCSRDIKMREDLNELVREIIVMSEYSNKLFSDTLDNIIVKDNFKNEDGYVLFERTDPKKYETKINELIIYYWNRNYPSDIKCTIDFNRFEKVDEIEFSGESHELITRIIYKRKENV